MMRAMGFPAQRRFWSTASCARCAATRTGRLLTSVGIMRVPVSRISLFAPPVSPARTVRYLVGPTRSFQTSSRRRDVFFLALPQLKAGLLTVVRSTLIVLPFLWRYRAWQRYPRVTRSILTIPIFGICLIVALGIDQAPRTHRWRLLMMSEHEERDWAERRLEELLSQEGRVLLPPDDRRVKFARAVCQRLLETVEEETEYIRCLPMDYTPFTLQQSEETKSRVIAPAAPEVRSDEPFVTRKASAKRTKKSTEEPPNNNTWSIYVLDLPKINAFVLPNRSIVVYSGLISFLDYDEELVAAILSHEITHALQRHSVENMGFAAAASIFFDVLRGISYAFTISFPLVADAAGSVLNFLNDTVASRAYSRKLESEADLVGVQLMAAAQYDPRAALDLWDIMGQLEEDMSHSSGGKASLHDASSSYNPFTPVTDASNNIATLEERVPFLRTHPSHVQRLKDLEKVMPKAMDLYRETRRKSQLRQGDPIDKRGVSAIAVEGTAQLRTSPDNNPVQARSPVEPSKGAKAMEMSATGETMTVPDSKRDTVKMTQQIEKGTTHPAASTTKT